MTENKGHNRLKSLKESFRLFLQKRGGAIASILFHALLFFILLIRMPVISVPDRPPVNQVSINLAPAIATRQKDAEKVEESKPAPPENVDAEPVQESKEEPVQKPEIEVTGENERESEEDVPQASEVFTERPEEKEAVISRRELLNLQKTVQESEQTIEKNLAAFQNRIDARAAEMRGIEDEFSSEGADEGTVRTLDVKNIPETVLESVLKRYGIRITQRYVEGGSSIPFLNQARINDKTYDQRFGSGFYEVFELSPEALKYMTVLEEREMRRRGLDPASTRVIKVVFGIVGSGSGYELSIIEFEYQEID